jgi:hypothetical protein
LIQPIRQICGRFFLLFCLCLASCEQKHELNEIVADTVEVLETNVPLWYQSANGKKNRVIATLHHGDRFYLRGEGFGKDYKYFDVQLMSGEKGFLFYDGREPQFRRIETGK